MKSDPVFFIILCSLIVGGCCVWLIQFIRHRFLRRQHHLQLQLLHNIPVGLCYDHNGKILLNKTWRLMWDLPKRPRTMKDLIRHLPAEDKNFFVQNYNLLIQKGIPFDGLIHHGNQVFHLRARPFENNARVFWINDLSRYQEKFDTLNQNYDQLNQQKQLLEDAWENFPFPTFIRSAQGKVIFANQAVGKNETNELNQYHWQTRPFQSDDTTYTLTYGQETRTEEEMQSMVREIATAHRRLCQELPCAVCLFNAKGHLVACSPEFARLWQLDETWLDTRPDYEDFWDTLQEKGLLSRVMDFSQYKKQQREQFSQLSKTEEIFLYLPSGKIIRRLMIPFAQGGVILLDEEKTG